MGRWGRTSCKLAHGHQASREREKAQQASRSSAPPARTWAGGGRGKNSPCLPAPAASAPQAWDNGGALRHRPSWAMMYAMGMPTAVPIRKAAKIHCQLKTWWGQQSPRDRHRNMPISAAAIPRAAPLRRVHPLQRENEERRREDVDVVHQVRHLTFSPRAF